MLVCCIHVIGCIANVHGPADADIHETRWDEHGTSSTTTNGRNYFRISARSAANAAGPQTSSAYLEVGAGNSTRPENGAKSRGP